MPQRTRLVKLSGVPSSYKNKKGERLDVESFGESAFVAPDMAAAIKKLLVLVTQDGGQLFVTDLFRPWKTQAAARKKYDDYMALPAKERKLVKPVPFAAPPGGSFHQAGRAVDFDVKNLKFPGLDRSQWLQKFWDLAKPLGFKPIIRIPDLDMSECWHFDFPGTDWELAYKQISYTEVAKCAIIDAGCWSGDSDEKTQNLFIQSQLIRLSFFEIGSVDGVIGKKTTAILKKMGLDLMTKEKICQTLAERR